MHLPRVIVGIVAPLLGAGAWAHVPYLEEADFSAEAPFVVADPAQSKAIYGWLRERDVDLFALETSGPDTVHLGVLVPECREYRLFNVSLALVGPGLPAPATPLPFPVPAGQGVVVLRDDATGPRATTYEMFSERSYYQGPEAALPVPAAGAYRLAVWSESGASGDYVAVIGHEERFSAADLERAARHTETIRQGGELRGACTAP